MQNTKEKIVRSTWAMLGLLTAIFVFLLCGCVKDNDAKVKGVGDDQTATVIPKTETEVHAGGDSKVWNITLSSVTQSAGYGLPLALMGWGVAGWGSRRHRKAMETLVEAIEVTDAHNTKRKVQSACNRWLNRQVARMTKGA